MNELNITKPEIPEMIFLTLLAEKSYRENQIERKNKITYVTRMGFTEKPDYKKIRIKFF